jgi:hypothetical protein
MFIFAILANSDQGLPCDNPQLPRPAALVAAMQRTTINTSAPTSRSQQAVPSDCFPFCFDAVAPLLIALMIVLYLLLVRPFLALLYFCVPKMHPQMIEIAVLPMRILVRPFLALLWFCMSVCIRSADVTVLDATEV